MSCCTKSLTSFSLVSLHREQEMSLARRTRGPRGRRALPTLARANTQNKSTAKLLISAGELTRRKREIEKREEYQKLNILHNSYTFFTSSYQCRLLPSTTNWVSVRLARLPKKGNSCFFVALLGILMLTVKIIRA